MQHQSAILFWFLGILFQKKIAFRLGAKAKARPGDDSLEATVKALARQVKEYAPLCVSGPSVLFGFSFRDLGSKAQRCPEFLFNFLPFVLFRLHRQSIAHFE